MRPHTFEAPEALIDAFSRDVSWIVKEAVMVLWEEAEPHQELEEECQAESSIRRTRLRSLGQPSATDKYPNVTLWIGRSYKRDEADEGQNDMIVLLQMTFHIKVSSGNRKKAFDMFCLVSTADLVLNPGHFLPISMNHLSPAVYDCLKHPEPSRRLLHVQFRVQQPSRVLMHRRPHIAKHVTGTPLHLMLLLQSLSRTLSFDAYLSHSTYAAECLKTVATTLESAVTTPPIDLDRVYAGVGGCFDYWEQFNPEHFAHAREAASAYLQHAQQSPPRYSSPTHHITPTRKRPRLCSSSTNSPPRYIRSECDRLQDAHHVPPPSYVPQQPNISLSPAFSPSAPVFPPTPLALPPTIKTSDSTPSPTVMVAASDLHTSPDQITADYSDYVPDSPLESVCTPDAAITAPHAASPPIITLPPAAPSPSSEHSLWTAPPTLVPTLTCLLRSWILDMNTLSPEFYKLRRFHVMLLSLASAAISGSKNDFVKAKAKATTSVLVLARKPVITDHCSSTCKPDLHSAVLGEREKDKEIQHVIDLNLLHELDLLLQWMYTHDLDATGAEPGYKYGDGPLLAGLRQMAAWGVAFRKTLKTRAPTLHPSKGNGDKSSDAGKCEAKAELRPEALVQGFRRWEGECVAHFYLSLVAKTE